MITLALCHAARRCWLRYRCRFFQMLMPSSLTPRQQTLFRQRMPPFRCHVARFQMSHDCFTRPRHYAIRHRCRHVFAYASAVIAALFFVAAFMLFTAHCLLLEDAPGLLTLTAMPHAALRYVVSPDIISARFAAHDSAAQRHAARRAAAVRHAVAAACRAAAARYAACRHFLLMLPAR